MGANSGSKERWREGGPDPQAWAAGYIAVVITLLLILAGPLFAVVFLLFERLPIEEPQVEKITACYGGGPPQNSAGRGETIHPLHWRGWMVPNGAHRLPERKRPAPDTALSLAG
jgi:hypothetical protein